MVVKNEKGEGMEDEKTHRLQPKLERKGECNNCGWCCQFLMPLRTTVAVTSDAGKISSDQEKFYNLRNAIKGADGKMRLMVHGFAPCMAHDNIEKKCTIYENRPQVCRDFPVLPEQIEGTPCSYYFEVIDVDGNIIERRGGLNSLHPTPPRFES